MSLCPPVSQQACEEEAGHHEAVFSGEAGSQVLGQRLRQAPQTQENLGLELTV
jgi:hypothetical protein